jgi:hypothetical protein
MLRTSFHQCFFAFKNTLMDNVENIDKNALTLNQENNIQPYVTLTKKGN